MRDGGNQQVSTLLHFDVCDYPEMINSSLFFVDFLFKTQYGDTILLARNLLRFPHRLNVIRSEACFSRAYLWIRCLVTFHAPLF